MDSDNFEMAKNFFLDGLKYFQNQEFQDAEFSFLKSLELVPNRASILNNLASTQIKLYQPKNYWHKPMIRDRNLIKPLLAIKKCLN